MQSASFRLASRTQLWKLVSLTLAALGKRGNLLQLLHKPETYFRAVLYSETKRRRQARESGNDSDRRDMDIASDDRESCAFSDSKMPQVILYVISPIGYSG